MAGAAYKITRLPASPQGPMRAHRALPARVALALPAWVIIDVHWQEGRLSGADGVVSSEALRQSANAAYLGSTPLWREVGCHI